MGSAQHLQSPEPARSPPGATAWSRAPSAPSRAQRGRRTHLELAARPAPRRRRRPGGNREPGARRPNLPARAPGGRGEGGESGAGRPRPSPAAALGAQTKARWGPEGAAPPKTNLRDELQFLGREDCPGASQRSPAGPGFPAKYRRRCEPRRGSETALHLLPRASRRGWLLAAPRVQDLRCPALGGGGVSGQTGYPERGSAAPAVPFGPLTSREGQRAFLGGGEVADLSAPGFVSN